MKPLSGYAWRTPSESMEGTNSVRYVAAPVDRECQGMGGRQPKGLIVIVQGGHGGRRQTAVCGSSRGLGVRQAPRDPRCGAQGSVR